MTDDHLMDLEIESIKQLFTNQTNQLKFGLPPLGHEHIPDKDFLIQFAKWSEDRYMRVCLGENKHCEMILICWEEGQATAIHNHDGQKCWVYIIDGLIKEKIYTSDRDPKLLQETTYKEGGITYMDDTKGCHSLSNITKGRAMTLHLYTSPIQQCQVFSNKKKCFETKNMKYHATIEEFV